MRMRASWRLLAILAGFTVSGACAQQAYVGAGLGQGQVSFPSVSRIGAAAATSSDGKTAENSLKVYAGYQWTPAWGIEFGYNALGNGYSLNIASAGGTATTKVNLSNLYTAGTWTLPLGSAFSVLGKLGVARSDARIDRACIGANCLAPRAQYHWTPVLGVGAEYSFARNYRLRLELEDFGSASLQDPFATGDGGTIKARAWTLSLQARF
jgi:OOP family OmpA-OmpF porin